MARQPDTFSPSTPRAAVPRVDDVLADATIEVEDFCDDTKILLSSSDRPEAGPPHEVEGGTPPADTVSAEKVSGPVPPKIYSRRETVPFDSSWLAEHVTTVTGANLTARGARIVLRRLAQRGAISRNVGTDSSRYAFTGPDDPRVEAVIEEIRSEAAGKTTRDTIVRARAAAVKTAAETALPHPADDDLIEDLVI
jgi:hypothetical protein